MTKRKIARRQRALQRFSIKPRSAFHSDETYDAYMHRKNQELRSLKGEK